MLARGIRSYHRPTRLEEAMSLVAQGAVPLAGGTRLLATSAEVPNIVDLSALDLMGMKTEDEDLVLGSMATLQDAIDSPLAYPATGGLLPAACRAQSASRMIRGMATLGGESVNGDRDSEVVAALLALNAVYVVAHPQESRESPALRFLRNPAEDLVGGGIVQAIVIPGAPDGAALERLAVAPSATPLLSVAATVTFAGENCSRARIALTGLETRPARVLEAEAYVERTGGDEKALVRCVDQVVARAPFREDAQVSAAYRRRAARVLTLRALRRAVAQARRRSPLEIPRLRPRLPQRAPTTLPYFTSGRIEVTVNGHPLRAEVEARTTLVALLRSQGFQGAKLGCETGDCGACAVLLDGRPVNACLKLAVGAQGRSVQTVEGLGQADGPHPLPTAFRESGATGCGFCTSAMQLSAKALLDAIPDPDEGEVRDALAGCLCSCTGYVKPVEAVLRAASSGGENGG
ncbi:MAG TPA: FAD binding domain-containing protein [Vicinamibacteria bacterium]|jgi:aerobic-type carbon monoxide dehydrogenase small subunit (CoxS/CutS family)/CO/xanthine dehydrogenase FAD-binding subunit|nr:FAD binding domain-containing protein [Vicinamibacteria bacterium]